MDKKEALIRSVKSAVSKYGISGVSTRNIGEMAKVNDSNIYRFFKDKEELLLQAYIRENGAIFSLILREIDNAHNLDISFKEKAIWSFEKTWREILSDDERLIFCASYYHSKYFYRAFEHHNKQLDEIASRLGCYFLNDDDCKHAINSICSVLYDSALAVIQGCADDTEEYLKRVFETEMAIFISQAKKIQSVSMQNDQYYDEGSTSTEK